MAQDPFRLSLQLTHADGSTTRWGPDEPDPINIPDDFEFSTSMPGGFSDAQCSLFRRIDTDYADQNLLDDVTVLGPGNQVVFDGRMQQFPRQHGDTFTVTPGAEGWVAHLRDDETFSCIYADRDLTGWGSMSRSRRISLIGSGVSVYDPQTTVDTTNGLPCITTSLQGPWTTDGRCEALYDAGPGNLIGAVYYDFLPSGNISGGDATWSWYVYSLADDALSATEGTGNLRAASGSGYFTPTTARRYGMLQSDYGASGGTDGQSYDVNWRPTVYGDHGLTRRGSDPGGFYGGDILAHCLPLAAPFLKFTTGAGGSIEQGSTAIGHLVFRDPTTGEDVVRQVTDYEGKEWGVYEDREFFWRDPDPDRCCWQVRLDQGARPKFDGPSGQTVVNGVFIVYQDPAGVTHTVGPPGSNAEITDSALEDPSPGNPATAKGLRKWPKLSLDFPTTSDAAITIGALWLRDRLSPQRRGDITLTGMVQHPTMGPRPAWQVRAGDYLQITDSGNTAQRRIIATHYRHGPRSVDVTLDNVSPAIDALMTRVSASLQGVI